MTFGSGVHGSLGHGNHNDVVQAKIVEALIGFEVEQVSRAGLQQGGVVGRGQSCVLDTCLLYHVIDTIY